MQLKPINNPDQRRAFTIIELLIVMGIIVLIAAVTLPTVKDLLKDQKTSQTARVIQGFADSARSRAIGTGRPVAMVIERMYMDGSRDLEGNDTAIRLSIGEVFPPYEGDWANARATIIDTPGNGMIRGTSFAEILLTEAASLWDTVSSQPSGLVQPGDIIMFGDSRRSYRIADNNGDGQAITLPAGSPPRLNIEFDNPPFDEDQGVVLGEPAVFPAGSVRFRIYRRPSKSLAGSVMLPRGMCIDLSGSGIGQSGLDFGTQAISASARSGDLAVAQAPGAYGPVYIVFDPSGGVRDLYYGLTPNTPAALVVRRSVGYPIHLLVGRTEQVFPNAVGYLGPDAIPSPSVSARDEVRYNILDPANYWVTINPFSGAVTSTQVQSQTAFPQPSATLTPVARGQLRVAQSRSIAISGTQRSEP